MTTWTSKHLIALGLASVLGACEAMDTGTTLLAGLAPLEDAALPAVPLTQAMMMRGGVTLVPPSGYCIDPESLSHKFALMARCDNMGAATGGEGAPAGVLTVSLTRNVLNPILPRLPLLVQSAGLHKKWQPRQVLIHPRTHGRAITASYSARKGVPPRLICPRHIGGRSQRSENLQWGLPYLALKGEELFHPKVPACWKR